MDQNKKFQLNQRYSGKIFHFLILLVIFGVLVLLLNQGPLSSCTLHQFDGSTGYSEPGWIYRQGPRVLEQDLTTPAFREMETGKSYSISTTLTYDGSDDQVPTCFFFVDHMHIRVYLDGELLLSYTPEDVAKPDHSKSPGNVYASVPLPRDCQGRELTIEFIPALDMNIEYQLPNPVFGNFSTTAVHTFRGELLHNVIAVLAFFLGMAAILFSTLALKGSLYREGLFIGIFAVLFSLYNITESDFDFYMISNPYYTYVLDYTTFTLMPIFLIAFLRERLDPRQRPLANVMIFVAISMFLTEMVLHFTGVMDMREFLPVVHVVYALDVFTVFFLLVTMKKNRWKNHLVMQMIPIMIGLLLDLAVYYKHWQLSSSDSTFTAIGLIIFLIAELYHVWKYSIDIYSESVRSQDYRAMAYIDSLTGIGNRRAFDMEKMAIEGGERQYRSLIVASADVNNLKLTNDTFGHAAGDFLIRSAANLLSDLSADYGHPFRMGGDEFCVLLYNMEVTEFEERLRKLEQQEAEINSNSDIKVSLALGYEICYGRDLVTAISLADKKMYADKALFKSMHGIS